jgi:hypothetical protein
MRNGRSPETAASENKEEVIAAYEQRKWVPYISRMKEKTPFASSKFGRLA